MEIYKLSDEVPCERRRDLTKCKKCDIARGEEVFCDGGDSREDLKITGMQQGVRNPERVNVFVNGEFAFSLSVAQVVDLHLKTGMVLTKAQLAEFKVASELGKLYQRALEWVLARPRSERETYDYLSRKVYEKKLDKDCVSGILEKLKKRRYVDDTGFASWYVENRLVKKGISKKRLKLELMKKGVSTEIIEAVLGGRDDKEEILKMIAKKRGKYTDEKLVAYLCRQGFSYDLARELVQEEDRE